jgi:hypothetical protein
VRRWGEADTPTHVFPTFPVCPSTLGWAASGARKVCFIRGGKMGMGKKGGREKENTHFKYVRTLPAKHEGNNHLLCMLRCKVTTGN